MGVAGIVRRVTGWVALVVLVAASLPAGPATARVRWEAAPRDLVVDYGGPIAASERAALDAAGAEIVEYLGDFAYRVRFPAGEAATASRLPGVAAVRPVPAPSVPRISGPAVVEIGVEPGGDPDAVAARLGAGGLEVVAAGPRRLLAAAGPDTDAVLTGIPGIAWVEPYRVPEVHADAVAGLVGAPAARAAGYDGAGQVIAIADTGLGGGTAADAHPDLPPERVRSILNHPGVSNACYDVVDDGARDVSSGHGTHVAGIALGEGGTGIGVAPGAELVFQAVENYAAYKGACAGIYPDGYKLIGIPDDLTDLFAPAYAAGARIHSNSWGTAVYGAYSQDAADLDAFVYAQPDLTIVVSTGNRATDRDADGVVDPDSIDSPATAKNAIAVGASEGDRRGDYACDPARAGCAGTNTPFTYGAGFGFPAPPLAGDPSAGNAGQVAAFSGRGPTNDGRIKPDLVAPATWVASAYSPLYRQGYDPDPNPTDGAWQGDGWGLPRSGEHKYLGGTSMAAPAVAGAAAVVRQFYSARGHDASAALVKATLINSAVDLADENGDGVDDNALPIPNIHEGWGRLDVAGAVDPGRRFAAHAGLDTGTTAEWSIRSDGTDPLKTTIAWSDAPSALSAPTNLVNDLDLTLVAPDGTVYRGNDFAAGWTRPDGTTADRVNNVENVFVAAPAPGVWTVRVTAFNIPMGPQPFALVVAGSSPPSVTLTEPEPGAELAGVVALAAEAAPPVAAVTFEVDGVPVGTDLDGGDGWSVAWDSRSRADGPATVTAVATDDLGARGTDSAAVTIDNVNDPPTVAFVAPAPGAAVAGAVELVLEATDAEGVARVDVTADSGVTVLVTARDRYHRYAPDGTRLDTVLIPYGAGADRPYAERVRDIAVTGPGEIAAYNGTFAPYLSSSGPGGWTHTAVPGWDTANNISYGGIAVIDGAVFATDMALPGEADPAGGLLRAGPGGEERFGTGRSFIDVSAGPGGLVYGLEANGTTVVAYDAVSLAETAVIGLDHPVRGIAVTDSGDIVGASWTGELHRFGPAGAVAATARPGLGSLFDVDVLPGGRVAAASRFGGVLLTTTDFADLESFTPVVPSAPFVALEQHAEAVGTATAPGADGRYRVIWDAGAARGEVTLTAVVTDTGGQTAAATLTLQARPPVPNAPPSISITHPAAGSTVAGTVAVECQADDDVGVVAVVVRVNGAEKGRDEDGTDGWSVAWDTTGGPDGDVEITAVAVDAAGAEATATRAVTVQNADPAPTVEIVTPGPGATLSGAVEVAGLASADAVGVAVTVNGDPIGASAPVGGAWSVAWDTTTVPDGAHVVAATAEDAAGQTATASVTVEVDNLDTPPSVSLLAPAPGATVSGVVAMVAAASDDRGVVEVRFLADGVEVGVDHDGADGWSTSWYPGPVDAVVVLSAVARDTAGAAATAPPVTITVANGSLAPGIHVAGLEGTAAAFFFWWRATVRVTVHDESAGPAAGVTAAVSWHDGAAGGCVTAGDGSCRITRWFSRATPEETAAVTGLTHPDLVHRPELDVVQEVAVLRP